MICFQRMQGMSLLHQRLYNKDVDHQCSEIHTWKLVRLTPLQLLAANCF